MTDTCLRPDSLAADGARSLAVISELADNLDAQLLTVVELQLRRASWRLSIELLMALDVLSVNVESSVLTLDSDDRRLDVGVDFGCDSSVLTSLCRLTVHSAEMLITLVQSPSLPQSITVLISEYSRLTLQEKLINIQLRRL